MVRGPAGRPYERPLRQSEMGTARMLASHVNALARTPRCAEAEHSGGGARHYWPKALGARVHNGQFWCLTGPVAVRKVNGRWIG